MKFRPVPGLKAQINYGLEQFNFEKAGLLCKDLLAVKQAFQA
jgi:hypothetical protein